VAYFLSMPLPLTWTHEQELKAQGKVAIAGVDEAGRGCLAGPVVASAVLYHSLDWMPQGLNDSKKLSRQQRIKLFHGITTSPHLSWAVGTASVEEIDSMNISQASHLAMQRALELLPSPYDWVLVDGLRVPRLGSNQTPLIGGDALSPSIATASIIAKETRDRLMEELGTQLPQYHFAKHKGYGTQAHLEALKIHGVSPHHRKSFAPVRQLCLF
jgi:ribonuclease HII